MNFKDVLKIDNEKTFLNPDEFSEPHDISGRVMNLMIDNNEMIEREKRGTGGYRQGTFQKTLLFYVSAREFGPLPSVGRSIVLDGEHYIVTDAIDEDGIYSISLEARRA